MGSLKSFAFTQSMTELYSAKVPTVTLGHPVDMHGNFPKIIASCQRYPWWIQKLVECAFFPKIVTSCPRYPCSPGETKMLIWNATITRSLRNLVWHVSAFSELCIVGVFITQFIIGNYFSCAIYELPGSQWCLAMNAVIDISWICSWGNTLPFFFSTQVPQGVLESLALVCSAAIVTLLFKKYF